MLYELFVKAISISKDEQKKYLVEIKRIHPELFDELLEMLKGDDTSKEMGTQYWSSLMINESASIINSAQDLSGLIISSFELTELIDKGGMGSVYKAQRCDEQFEQTVAIKIIHSELEQVIGEHALIREAGFMAKLTHPNIGKVFDAGISDDGYHFIVMEYIEGCTITQKFTEPTLTLTLNEKLKIFCDLCDAVNHAHQMQVIHADLKPANILITQENQIKILDFGIARMFNSRSTDSSAAYTSYLNAMTASFASPELLAGDRPNMYSDIYALGKIFSALFTQQSINKSNYHCELEALVNKATAVTPSERYVSVFELKNDITRFISGYVATSYQASRLYRINKFVFNRHPISVTTGLIFIITFSTLTSNLFIQYYELKNEKYQTDLMLEKFSLVLDLDYDARSDVEMTLANNYESRNEDEKALKLYRKIISTFNKLNDTDIAFDAGSKLIKLLIKMQDSELIENMLGSLNNKLDFSPGSNVPMTVSQAMFHHFFIGSVYYWEEKNNSESFKYHSKLILGIKEHYWHKLSNSQKADLLFSINKADIAPELATAPSTSYYPEPKKLSDKNSTFDSAVNQLSSLKSSVYQFISKLFFIDKSSKYLPHQQHIHTFLESAPIFWASTHQEYFNYESINQSQFSDGTIKFKEHSGVYKADNNTLTMDFGEGAASDKFVYVTSKLALSVPLSGGDLTVLAHKDFISDNAHQQWLPDELIGNDWYHVYDSSLSPNKAIIPSIVEVKFKDLTANLVKGSRTININWSINRERLTLTSLDNTSPPVKLIKVASDSNIIIVKDGVSSLPSVLINNKELAEYIINYWQELLQSAS